MAGTKQRTVEPFGTAVALRPATTRSDIYSIVEHSRKRAVIEQ
jgi:hypothetical protein